MVASERQQSATERRSQTRRIVGRGALINQHRRRRRGHLHSAFQQTFRLSRRDTSAVYAVAVIRGKRPQDIVSEAVQQSLALVSAEPMVRPFMPLGEEGYRQVTNLLSDPPHANPKLRDLLTRLDRE